MDREHRKALELIEHQRIEIADLKYRLSELTRRLYGSTSEKGNPDQLKLLELDDNLLGANERLELPAGSTRDGEEPAADSSKKKRRKQERLRKSMKGLATTTEIIEPEEVRQDPESWKLIGEEITEELHFEPSRCRRHQIIRRKYARRDELDEAQGKNVTIAPLPPRLLEGSVLTPSLLAGLITGKYCWHQPLHRQEQMMRAAGVECSRSLMCHWFEIGADFLEPLYRSYHRKLLASDYLQVDETPIDYLAPGNGRTKKGSLGPPQPCDWSLLPMAPRSGIQASSRDPRRQRKLSRHPPTRCLPTLPRLCQRARSRTKLLHGPHSARL